ncbi:hypothetical protein KFU94_11050 [Chloroflexi bacterium TSY]|nr:hypothetical protein [Chloroflexi bacterium TSY]
MTINKLARKRQRYWKAKGGIILICIVSTLAAICPAYAQEGNGQPGTKQTERGVENPSEIRSPAKVITTESDAFLTAMSDNGTLSFSRPTDLVRAQSVDAIDALSVGDIVVSDVTDAAPYGFLRRVANVKRTDSGVVVKTVQATLAEAIGDGTLDTSQVQLTPDDVVSITDNNGEVITSAALPGSPFRIQLDNVVLSDGLGGLATIDGTIDLSANFRFSADFSRFRLIDLDFENSANVYAEIDVDVEQPLAGFHRKKRLRSYEFRTITVWVGWIPVVLTPRLDMYVGLDGDISVAITAGMTQGVNIDYDLTYSRGIGWNLDREVDFYGSNIMLWGPITTYSLEAFAGPELTLAVYGVEAPYANLYGALDLEINMADSRWWTMYGGFKGEIGVRLDVEVLGYTYTIVDYAYPIYERKWIVAQASPSERRPRSDRISALVLQPKYEIYLPMIAGG